jgi:hypothetical protein
LTTLPSVKRFALRGNLTTNLTDATESVTLASHDSRNHPQISQIYAEKEDAESLLIDCRTAALLPTI